MIVIHHNPDCGMSCNILALMREGNEAPVVIDYLSEGWTRPQLLSLFGFMLQSNVFRLGKTASIPDCG